MNWHCTKKLSDRELIFTYISLPYIYVFLFTEVWNFHFRFGFSVMILYKKLTDCMKLYKQHDKTDSFFKCLNIWNNKNIDIAPPCNINETVWMSHQSVEGEVKKYQINWSSRYSFLFVRLFVWRAVQGKITFAQQFTSINNLKMFKIGIWIVDNALRNSEKITLNLITYSITAKLLQFQQTKCDAECSCWIL